MQTRTLGKDLTVSAVGLGCMGFSHAYGAPTEEKDTINLLRQAVDIGYTFLTPQRCMEHRQIPMSMNAWWGKRWRLTGTR